MATPDAGGRGARRSGKTQARAAKRPRCRICERAIHVPEGWASGAAVRRHYWARHPEVMRPDPRAGS